MRNKLARKASPGKHSCSGNTTRQLDRQGPSTEIIFGLRYFGSYFGIRVGDALDRHPDLGVFVWPHGQTNMVLVFKILE